MQRMMLSGLHQHFVGLGSMLIIIGQRFYVELLKNESLNAVN